MKRTILLGLSLIIFSFTCQAQKLSKDEIARYETEIRTMINYLEETVNFLGDSTTTHHEKEIVYTESWNKIFINDKVQVEDDLDNNRTSHINKDVQAYLKDIDFFFKNAHFKFDIQNIANSNREDGSVYFKVTLTRHLVAKTIANENVDNVKNRFVEINLDRQKSSLKIASIYTEKINEKEALRSWWNDLSKNWKKRLGNGIMLYDSIPVETVSAITNTEFTASYKVFDKSTGDTTLQSKVFKNDMNELDKKLKLVTQRQHVDISGLREIISLEPLNEISNLTSLDISGTSIEDISPLRSANNLKILYANSSLIEDISALKYDITLEELDLSNTGIDDLSVLAFLKNLKKLNIANTSVSRIANLKNCPNLVSLNLNGCQVSNIVPLQDLTELKTVDIGNTSVRDLTPVGYLKNLQSLNISGTQVTSLKVLAELENLRDLYCSNTSINDLSPLKNHRRLSKIYCDHSNISDLEASEFTKNNPYTLVIFDTEALKKWWNDLPIYWKAVFSKQININAEPTTEQLHQIINLQELDLSGNKFMQNLMPVSRLTNLKSLNISKTEISYLQAIQGLTNLESLNLQGTFIDDISPLHDLTNLKLLNISNTSIHDLTPLANDPSIEVIYADSTTISTENVIALKENQRQVNVIYQTESLMDWWNGLDDIWKSIFLKHVPIQTEIPDALELQRIVDLREIVIESDTPITSLDPIAGFLWLERLTINDQGIHDLTSLSNKKYMVELNAQNNPITDLTPIESNTMMELLNLENTQIRDLDALSKMDNLITLNVGGTPIKSVKPLSGLTKLENLFINNTNVKSLSPIENIASLKQLKVYNTKIKSKAIESLQQKRLDLNIIYY